MVEIFGNVEDLLKKQKKSELLTIFTGLMYRIIFVDFNNLFGEFRKQTIATERVNTLFGIMITEISIK